MGYGLLGSLLHIGRIFGVAPFSSLSTFQVSRSYAIFGKILAVINSLLCPIQILIETINVWNDRVRHFTTIIIRWTNYGILAVIVSFGILTGPDRILRVGEQLETLNQINSKLGQRKEGAIKKVLLIFIIVTHEIVQLILRITITTANLNEHLPKPSGTYVKIWHTLYMVTGIDHIICNMIMLQVVCFVWKVLSTLLTVNLRLEEIITEISNSCQFIINKKLPKLAWEADESVLYKFGLNRPNRRNIVEDINSRTSRKETVLKLIRELGNHLINVCDIVKVTNEGEGTLMGIIVTYFFLHLEINLFLIVMWAIDKKKEFYNSYNIVASSVKFLSHGVFLVVFSEPCHRISAELQHLHILINKLRSRINSDPDATIEVEMYQRLLSTHTPSYSPLDLYTLNRFFVFKVLGGAITSLILLLSYGPDNNLIHRIAFYTETTKILCLRLRSGHIPLNKFAFMMKKTSSPKCDICDVIEDVQHFLVECAPNAEKRNELIRKFNINLLDIGIFQSILADPSSEIARMLYNFKLK